MRMFSACSYTHGLPTTFLACVKSCTCRVHIRRRPHRLCPKSARVKRRCRPLRAYAEKWMPLKSRSDSMCTRLLDGIHCMWTTVSLVVHVHVHRLCRYTMEAVVCTGRCCTQGVWIFQERGLPLSTLFCPTTCDLYATLVTGGWSLAGCRLSIWSWASRADTGRLQRWRRC